MRSNTRPADRERTFTEDARRAQILACAIEVIAEFGYAQASFARIAERLGTSKSVISYHFSGKDELLEQVVRSVYTEGANHILPRVAEARTPPEKLATYLRSNLEYIRDNPAGIAAVTEIVINARSRDGAPRFAGGERDEDPAIGFVREILRSGQENGDFGEFDTRTTAWAIRTMIDSVNRQRRLDPAFDFDTCITELIALFERATSTPPETSG